jgi:hypothetical protein
MDHLTAMETFVRVVDAGSFSGAPKQLRIGPLSRLRADGAQNRALPKVCGRGHQTVCSKSYANSVCRRTPALGCETERGLRTETPTIFVTG